MASNSENTFDILREPLFVTLARNGITPVPPPIIHQRAHRGAPFINHFPTVYKPNITVRLYIDDIYDSDDSDEEEIM